jgi:hypothetical protein
MIYLVSVCGYEEYMPVYFRCECSKEEFNVEVSKAISQAVEKLQDDDGFIDGHDLQDEIVPILAKKFEHVQMDYEVLLHGECLYSDDYQKPETITDDAWMKILEHNKKIHDEIRREVEEEHPEIKNMEEHPEIKNMEEHTEGEKQ